MFCLGGEIEVFSIIEAKNNRQITKIKVEKNSADSMYLRVKCKNEFPRN